jgi:hypothetical protein
MTVGHRKLAFRHESTKNYFLFIKKNVWKKKKTNKPTMLLKKRKGVTVVSFITVIPLWNTEV